MIGFNLDNFKDQHDIHDYEDLQKPLSMSYVNIFEKYSINGSLSDWVQEFEPKN